jgi:5-formyltetrahydrofolate cyclo-ligase
VTSVDDRLDPGLGPARAQKIALRDQLTTARRRIPLPELREHAEAIARHLLASDVVRRAATVAAYVSVGTEPGTGPLLDGLVAAGKRVILPVVLPDLDLDWAVHTGALEGHRGLLEPDGPTLGVDAIATADVVLAPGLAVDDHGVRMGKGGGCYDRALGRVPVGTPVWVLLHDHERVARVPREPHDRPVNGVVTPSGWSPLPTA